MPKVPVRKRQKHVKTHKISSPAIGVSIQECASSIIKHDNVISTDFHRDLEETADASEASSEFISSPACSSPAVSSIASPLLSPSPSSAVSSDHCYASPESFDGTYLSTPSPNIDSNIITPEPTNRKTSTQLLMDVREKLLLCLPLFWVPILNEDGVYALMLSRQSTKAIQRSIFFSAGGDVKIEIHCQSISADQFIKNTPMPKELTKDSVGDFVDRAVSIVNKVRTKEVCSGCDFEEYRSIWTKFDHGEVDKNPYQECRYTETLRSYSCSRLVDSSKWRCVHCSRLQPLLKKKLRAVKDIPHPNTKHSCLTEDQLLHKLSEQRKEILAGRRRIERMQHRMQELIKSEGVQVDKTLSDQLTEILRSANMSPAQSLFLQQQIKASQVQNMCGMKWHPTMIRIALAVHSTSPSAYETLRSSGVLRLPSARTLFDYTHFEKKEFGIDKVALQSVSETVEKCPHPYQKYHVLMADEMYISSKLVFQKSTGRLVGYTDLDDVDKEMRRLEEFLDGTDSSAQRIEATKILTYMVKGVSNEVKEVIAAYPVHNPTPNQMYSWTWDVIGALERSGVAVVAFVCDGHPSNRAFIKLHKPATVTASGVIYDTINKAAPHRKLYFIADVPHLLKTIRNCLAKSRLTQGKRLLKKNGEVIVWDTIWRLYDLKRRRNLRKSYKLCDKNVRIDSYSCMKVALAAQVLSRTVAQDIEDQKWTGVSETVKFIRLFNDWFDCLNGARSNHGTRKNNSRLHPYTSIEDKRFDFLLSVLDYLREWKEEAYSKPTGLNASAINFSVNEEETEGNSRLIPLEDIDDYDDGPEIPAAKRLLSQQTQVGIEMTVLSFIDVTRFLLSEGTSFVNARVFCQDPLEQYFSKQRAGGGGCTNPDLTLFQSKQRSLHVQGHLGVKRRKGNTESTETGIVISNERLPKRKSSTIPLI